MTLQQIKEQLRDSNLKRVAEASGLHYNVLTRLMNGDTDPRYSTVESLSEYLRERDNGKDL
jgi:predicted transcriptional regulator|tara:strand:- start:549 stop:731 length:183 start_codon:yes stop_codon:yes gene_type:complete